MKTLKILKLLFIKLPYLIFLGLSMRIESWAKRNKKLSKTLSYVFFPIYIILKLINWELNKEVCFREITDAKKTNYEHSIYSMCYHYMKFLSEIHKWKKIISRKWFFNIMEKHRLILYNYSIEDKSKTTYDNFKSHLGQYGYGYVFLGGARLNPRGSTIVEIK